MNEKIFYVIVLEGNEPNLVSWVYLNGQEFWRSRDHSVMSSVDILLPRNTINLPSSKFRIRRAPGEPNEPRPIYRYINEPVTRRRRGWICEVMTRQTQFIDPQTLISHII